VDRVLAKSKCAVWIDSPPRSVAQMANLRLDQALLALLPQAAAWAIRTAVAPAIFQRSQAIRRLAATRDYSIPA